MPNAPQSLVGIVMGSESDWEGFMKHAWERLHEIGIRSAAKNVTSVHRTPELVIAYARAAIAGNTEVIIAGAGGAAHLPGMMKTYLVETDPNTTIQVIGVPREDIAVNSLLHMPPGMPIITTAPGKLGAINAANLAAELLARNHPPIRALLRESRDKMKAAALAMDGRIAAL